MERCWPQMDSAESSESLGFFSHHVSEKIKRFFRWADWKAGAGCAMTCERSASKNRKAFGSLTGSFNDNPVGGTVVGRFNGKTNVSCEWDTENTDTIKVASPLSRIQRFKCLQHEAVKDCSSKNSFFYLILSFDKSSLNFKSQAETTQLHIRCVIVIMVTEDGLENEAADSQVTPLKSALSSRSRRKAIPFFLLFAHWLKKSMLPRLL